MRKRIHIQFFIICIEILILTQIIPTFALGINENTQTKPMNIVSILKETKNEVYFISKSIQKGGEKIKDTTKAIETFHTINEMLIEKGKNKTIDNSINIMLIEKGKKVYQDSIEKEREKEEETSQNNTSFTNIIQESNNANQSTQNNTFQDVKLLYSEPYNVCAKPLNKYMGVTTYNGHKETYYSQRILPGYGLNIPGRHVANDGTIRDGEGYIVVASDLSYMSRYSTLMTSLGPGKVYDTGCAYGVIDIYVDW